VKLPPLPFDDAPIFRAWLTANGLTWPEREAEREPLRRRFVREALASTRNPARPVDRCGVCEMVASSLDAVLAQGETQRDREHLAAAIIDWWVWASLHVVLENPRDPMPMIHALSEALRHNGLPTEIAGIRYEPPPGRKPH
jgi:hypothetical protein